MNHTILVLTGGYRFTVQSLSCIEMVAIRFSLVEMKCKVSNGIHSDPGFDVSSVILKPGTLNSRS